MVDLLHHFVPFLLSKAKRHPFYATLAVIVLLLFIFGCTYLAAFINRTGQIHSEQFTDKDPVNNDEDGDMVNNDLDLCPNDKEDWKSGSFY